MRGALAVMAGIVPGIHFVPQGKRFPQLIHSVAPAAEPSLIASIRSPGRADVDGRDKPGHDAGGRSMNPLHASRQRPWVGDLGLEVAAVGMARN